MKIETAAVIGMGALGLLFGSRIAEKHGMDVPVNRRFYETILEMEKDFL